VGHVGIFTHAADQRSDWLAADVGFFPLTGYLASVWLAAKLLGTLVSVLVKTG